MRCLAKAPAERYPDTTALALDLRRWQAGARRLPRSRGRRLLFTAFACATLGLGAWGISVRSSRPPPQDQGRGRIDLGREAAALWSRSKPLLVDAEAIEALARSLEALPEPAPSPRLTARVHALSGFLALARGQEGRAQAALERLEDPQATPAGRALAAALQGDARGLSHAIARGVRRPELRAWRIEARLEGELDPRAAREVLTDLDVLAAHEPLSPKRRAQRVLALLALPNLTRAEEALGELAKPGASLRWRVALSRARLELSEAPGEVLGRLEALPASEAHPERRRALARECLTLCAEVEDEAQEPLGPAQFEREAQLLRLTTLLAPLEPLPEPLVQSLLGQVSHSRMRLELALALSDAAPGRGDVQRAVALLSVRVTADQQARLLPTLRRAVSTEPRSEQRLRSKLLLTYALSKVHEPSSAITAEVQALTEGILALPLGSVQRSLALSNRARALAAAGRGREALRDYDRALALHDGVATGYVERGLLRQDLAQPSGALRDLLRYLELERRESASQREAVAAIWELTRAEGWEERALAPLKEITQLYPQRTGWWIRLAWLQLRLGAPSAAQETLTRAPAFRRASLEEAFGPALLRLRAKLEPRALDALVADLERMRAGETDP